MRKKDSFSIPAVGAGSLLCTFAVLCLTVFALLSFTTVRAESRLAEASAQAVTAYYEADLQAETIFACLRAGQLPEEVTRREDIYTYRCPISRQQYLDVALAHSQEGWKVLRWQAVAQEEPQTQEETLPVWEGRKKEEAP